MLRAHVEKYRRLMATGVALAGVFVAGCSTPQENRLLSSANEITLNETSRDLEEPSNLSPSLQRLADASETSRDIDLPPGAGQGPGYSQVGAPVPGTKDLFQVVIYVSPGVNLNALRSAGAQIQSHLGDMIYATVRARDMRAVSNVAGVRRVEPVGGMRIPTPPKGELQTVPAGGAARGGDAGKIESLKFDRKGLTGKGVIVGIVDTGIDWKHADFINPDGTSRIKYLWDIFDNTWETSKHTVGSEPPMYWEPGKPAGTIYTNAQINAALKGLIKIPRVDKVGHGTACAGTAAGNDLGVAPDADLVIVDSYIDSVENPENDGACGVQAAKWIKDVAAKEKRPCVISLSFGGSLNPHDGSGEEQAGYNAVVEKGNAAGVVICVSAGNDGQNSMHARGRFGPGVEGELTGGMSSPVQLIVTKQTPLAAYFDSKDDWGLLIDGTDKFLFGADNKPGHIKIAKKKINGNSRNDLVVSGSNNLKPADQETIKSLFADKAIDLQALPNGTDALLVDLLPGTYYVLAGGRSKQVTKGVFDFYLPDPYNAAFGMGGDHKMVVGSPGDADDVITIGSYDSCNQWENVSGATTFSGQVDLGNISDFSSAGFRRDGVIKPDVAAPGNFIISAFAVGSGLSMGRSTMTKDGKHVAWRGTSAACPYTAGVVALMLQKNAQLTANQTKQILRSTADHDLAVTGAVPNGEWGFGKLNAEKAIDAVTPGATPPPPTISVPIVTPKPIPGPATMPSVELGFEGYFKGDGVIVTLTKTDAGYKGEMTRGGQPFPLVAHAVADGIAGSATNNGKEYPFTAQLDGDKMTLHSGDKTFALTRQNADKPG